MAVSLFQIWPFGNLSGTFYFWPYYFSITLPTKVSLIKAIIFPVVLNGCESWTIKKAERWRTDALSCGVGEDSWESLGQHGDQTSPSQRKSVLNIHWKDWCWSWNSNTLATWCKELTHLKRPGCCEGLMAGGEGDDRGWDGWMASLTQWTWVWVNSRSWWWTGRPGVLRSMGSQRVGHDWATELNWTDFSKHTWTSGGRRAWSLLCSYYLLCDSLPAGVMLSNKNENWMWLTI